MKSRRIYLNTQGPANLFDLSVMLQDFISETELINGLVFMFSVGSTGALVATSDEKTFTDWVASKIPFKKEHKHIGNAFAHLRSTFLGSDVTLAVEGKDLRSVSKVQILENTAGRKQRPVELRAFGEFVGGGAYSMKVASNTLPVEANGWIDMIDLSQIAQDVILNSGVNDGFLQIESLAKDSAVSATEYEDALLSDTTDFLKELVGDVKEEKRSSIASAVLGPTASFPIKDGRLEVGTWQQPIFIDFGKPGPKDIFFQAIGM